MGEVSGKKILNNHFALIRGNLVTNFLINYFSYKLDAFSVKRKAIVCFVTSGHFNIVIELYRALVDAELYVYFSQLPEK